MKAGETDLTIITVSTNEGTQLADSARSVFAGLGDLKVEYFVIDNASTDSTSEVVAAYPDIRQITNTQKKGFATNNNLAMMQSTGKYILLLNPDTILDSDTLPFMFSYLEKHADVGAASCKLVNPDGSIQYTARRFPTPVAVFARWAHLHRLFPRMRPLQNYLMSDWDHQTERDVDWLVGAFIMVRRETLDTVGLLDPAFDPLYYEDIDWCYRIWKAGWRIRYVPHVKIVHLYDRESAQTVFNKWTFIHFRNILRYFWKHRRGL